LKNDTPDKERSPATAAVDFPSMLVKIEELSLHISDQHECRLAISFVFCGFLANVNYFKEI